jgi:hypothetical protein
MAATAVICYINDQKLLLLCFIYPMKSSPCDSPSCVQAAFECPFSPQSQRTCAERDLRSVRQWVHCDTGRPCGEWMLARLGRQSTRQAYLFVDMLQRPVRMLAIANTMAPHTCLTGILFTLDQHFGSSTEVVGGDWKMVACRRL